MSSFRLSVPFIMLLLTGCHCLTPISILMMSPNKLNISGTNLTIFEGGLAAKHTSPKFEVNTVQAILPVPTLNMSAINKPSIAFYFEVQILINKYRKKMTIMIGIGFCEEQFTMDNKFIIGKEKNSIGIFHPTGIWIDGSFSRIWLKDEGNDGWFKEGDFVGLGILHQPNSMMMQCFLTVNGKLIWKKRLPSKFNTLKLFPAITLLDIGDSVRVNFGKKEFQFNEFENIILDIDKYDEL